jgi:hypothetical protein
MARNIPFVTVVVALPADKKSIVNVSKVFLIEGNEGK